MAQIVCDELLTHSTQIGTKWILRRLKHVGIFMIYFRTNIDIMEGIMLDLQPAEVVKRDNFSVLRFMTKSFVYSRNLCTKLTCTHCTHPTPIDPIWRERVDRKKRREKFIYECQKHNSLHVHPRHAQTYNGHSHTHTIFSWKSAKLLILIASGNFFFCRCRLSVKWTTDHLQFFPFTSHSLVRSRDDEEEIIQLQIKTLKLLDIWVWDARDTKIISVWPRIIL